MIILEVDLRMCPVQHLKPSGGNVDLQMRIVSGSSPLPVSCRHLVVDDRTAPSQSVNDQEELGYRFMSYIQIISKIFDTLRQFPTR